jgi:aspartate/methionine/tyrosine aminotransferase
MNTSKRLEGIGEYYFSKKLREIADLNQQGKDIINLGIGSPDQPPHAEVIAVLQEESRKNNVHGYQSYKGVPALRRAIADWYKTWYDVEVNSEEEVLPLIGSKEGIMHICMTWLDEGDEALVPDPGYPTYQSAVQLAGGKVITYKLNEANDYEPDFNALQATDLGKVKLMFVNYPHMPSGKMPTRKLFQEIVDFGRRNNILIVHDNPYSFLQPLNAKFANPLSLLSVDGAFEVVVELNSLSKSHNMAGWRIGMLCGNKQRIDEVLRFKSNMDSGMFLPLQMAAVKAMSLGEEWFVQLNNMYSERRLKAYDLLRSLGCSFRMDQGGLFAWGKVGEKFRDGYELSDEVLYKANVFLTPGGIFGEAGNSFVRISLCATTDKLDDALSRIKSLNL